MAFGVSVVCWLRGLRIVTWLLLLLRQTKLVMVLVDLLLFRCQDFGCLLRPVVTLRVQLIPDVRRGVVGLCRCSFFDVTRADTRLGVFLDLGRRRVHFPFT